MQGTLAKIIISLTALVISNLCIADTQNTPLPAAIQTIMQKPAYQHALWAFYVKDLNSDKVLYQYNGEQMVMPASNTKLFTVSALLDTYGLDYRFKTPVYADGKINKGTLHGNLVLVAKGDLTMGGRRTKDDRIAFTNFDHVDANEIPGATLTKQDPLAGLTQLAKQVKQAGVTRITGHVLVDDRLFETIQKRANIISPIFINDNLLDVSITPNTVGKLANLTWRPHIPQVNVNNHVKTVAKGQGKGIEISTNDDQSEITVTGSIGVDETSIVNVTTIKHPKQFAQYALQQALEKQGIKVLNQGAAALPQASDYQNMKTLAELNSAPLIEYAKLILKVSHNAGANLIPLLLAVKHGETTYDQGMIYLGKYLRDTVKIPANQFVIAEAAGADKNRVTPAATEKLLHYWYNKPKTDFKQFVAALPTLGVDGSLATVEKNSSAKGHVFAKTGTSMGFDTANDNLFLYTKALAGYIQAPNGHWLAFMFTANNVTSPTINDLFGVLADTGAVTTALYESTGETN